MHSSVYQTIEEINRSLERYKFQTSEMKYRTAKVLEEANAYRTNSWRKNNNCRGVIERYNNDRFTASLNLYTTSQQPLSSSLPGEKQRISLKNQRNSSLDTKIQALKSSKKLSDAAKDKPADESHKVKNIIFKTLDSLFKIPDVPKTRKRSIVEQAKRVNSESDSLDKSPNLSEIIPSAADKLFTCKPVESNEVDKTITENEVGEVETIISSSGSEDSWLYVDNPIHIQQVVLEDSLNYSDAGQKQGKNLKKKSKYKGDASENQSPHPKPRRYSKKPAKGEGKIKKFSKNRHKEDKEKVAVANSPPFSKTTPKTCNKPLRPDSPIRKVKLNSRLTSSISLPNLMEISIDESNYDLINSDFNTDSFSRGIASRPSSTLKKSTSNVNVAISTVENNSELDEDAVSTTSTFSFSETFNTNLLYSNIQQQRNLAPVPSALCQNVLVMPISVPVRPIRSISNVRGISTQEFKKLSEAFIEFEEIGDHYTTTNTNTNVSTLKNHRLVEKSMQIDTLKVSKEEITIVKDAFSWLDDLNEGRNSNLEEDKENTEHSNFEETAIEQEEKTLTLNQTTSSCSTLNSSVPPPPPLPPPMPTSKLPIVATLRKRFPLKVFDKPLTGNNIFNRLNCVEMLESDALKLKETFPLLNNIDLNEQENRIQLQQKTSEAMKLNLNIELFLKKWDIIGPNVNVLLESISTLNAKPDSVDMNCIAALPISKKAKEAKKKNVCSAIGKFNATEAFLMRLNAIPSLHEKLECIKFSLDLEESTWKSFCQLELFTKECNIVNTSTKFIAILSILMEFMNRLNNENEGPKLYGFDIQSLGKLAIKTSKDGTTTLLHYLIEYILDNESSFPQCVDFYNDFNDLPTMAKISLKDIATQCKAWDDTLNDYKMQLELISKAKNTTPGSLEFPKQFIADAEKILTDLREKLNSAEQVFISCKECYGLSNTAITELEFFDSLSKFANAYRLIHNEMLEKRKIQQAQIIRRRLVPSSSNTPPQAVRSGVRPNRKSCDFSAMMNSEDVLGNVGDDELGQCLIEMLNDKRKKAARRRSHYN